MTNTSYWDRLWRYKRVDCAVALGSSVGGFAAMPYTELSWQIGVGLTSFGLVYMTVITLYPSAKPFTRLYEKIAGKRSNGGNDHIIR